MTSTLHSVLLLWTYSTPMSDRRFNEVFTRDDQVLPRNWTPKANIPAVAQQARQSAAKILALLAVIRLHAAKVNSFDHYLTAFMLIA